MQGADKTETLPVEETCSPSETPPADNNRASQRSRSPSLPASERLPKRPRTSKTMKVVVVGCTHGELDSLYQAVEEVERAQSISVDLIVCAGDFQAVRNEYDLRCMNCPDKYKDMRTFWKYYSGERKARIPTIFVGGNHEASNHLQEIPLGGLVAPNMYYVGNAGVVKFRGLRIGGVSGVFVQHTYDRKRMERPPYQRSDIRTVYHARREDTDRLLRIKRPVDIFLSHDWPRGITDFGNLDQLLRQKSHLRADITQGRLGSPGTQQILREIQPRFWFAAHMHVKFAALVPHEETGKETRFLSLDKILPGRDFLQVVDVPVEADGVTNADEVTASPIGEASIELDAEWLSILRTEANEAGRQDSVTEAEMEETVALLTEKGVRMDVKLESDFVRSAPVYGGGSQATGEAVPAVPGAFRMQPRNVDMFDALNLSSHSDYPRQADNVVQQGPIVGGNAATREAISPSQRKTEEVGQSEEVGEINEAGEVEQQGGTEKTRTDSADSAAVTTDTTPASVSVSATATDTATVENVMVTQPNG